MPRIGPRLRALPVAAKHLWHRELGATGWEGVLGEKCIFGAWECCCYAISEGIDSGIAEHFDENTHLQEMKARKYGKV